MAVDQDRPGARPPGAELGPGQPPALTFGYRGLPGWDHAGRSAPGTARRPEQAEPAAGPRSPSSRSSPGPTPTTRDRSVAGRGLRCQSCQRPGRDLEPDAASPCLRGSRGLPGGSSLARLLVKHRGKRHLTEPPSDRADPRVGRRPARTGRWPSSRSGPVRHAEAAWQSIDAAHGDGRQPPFISPWREDGHGSDIRMPPAGSRFDGPVRSAWFSLSSCRHCLGACNPFILRAGRQYGTWIGTM